MSYSDKKILAIIPARKGSKGLPNKNILECAGKPLIAWTIEAALSSAFIDKVLVTTDSEEVAEISEKWGAWVPFIRSADLAQDDSNIIDVVKDVITRVSDLGETFDYISLLQPTSPLRSSIHIDQAVEYYFSKSTSDKDTLVSVCEIERKILWALGEYADTKYMYSHFDIDFSNPRRQSLPRCYMPNGAIYMANSRKFYGFYGKNTLMYVMDDVSSLDVDYLADLEEVCGHLESNNNA